MAQFWTCGAEHYGAGDDGCDCGCGLVDPDCADATADSCEFCGHVGSCDESSVVCPGALDPADNSQCLP